MRTFGIFVVAAVSLFASFPVLSQTAGRQKPTVIVTGDSFSRQSGKCNSTNYALCEQAQEIPHQNSYSLYLNSATSYGVVVSDNSARGGDTCSSYPGVVLGGLHAGFPTGLTHTLFIPQQVDQDNVRDRILNRDGNVVSILIGANDVLIRGASLSALRTCLDGLLVRVGSSGKKVVMMTYPPVRSGSNIWSPGGTNINGVLRDINQQIRDSVTWYRSFSGAVMLADTSNAWTEAQAPLNTVFDSSVVDTVSASAPDGIHPNVAGARRIAAVWAQQVCGTGFVNC